MKNVVAPVTCHSGAYQAMAPTGNTQALGEE